MSRRIERVNALLREEIAGLLTREIQDPRLGTMVSITEVDTSPDLRNATVRVSILGSQDEIRRRRWRLSGTPLDTFGARWRPV